MSGANNIWQAIANAGGAVKYGQMLIDSDTASVSHLGDTADLKAKLIWSVFFKSKKFDHNSIYITTERQGDSILGADVCVFMSMQESDQNVLFLIECKHVSLAYAEDIEKGSSQRKRTKRTRIHHCDKSSKSLGDESQCHDLHVDGAFHLSIDKDFDLLAVTSTYYANVNFGNESMDIIMVDLMPEAWKEMFLIADKIVRPGSHKSDTVRIAISKRSNGGRTRSVFSLFTISFNLKDVTPAILLHIATLRVIDYPFELMWMLNGGVTQDETGMWVCECTKCSVNKYKLTSAQHRNSKKHIRYITAKAAVLEHVKQSIEQEH
jgi:hypothetical protein